MGANGAGTIGSGGVTTGGGARCATVVTVSGMA